MEPLQVNTKYKSITLYHCNSTTEEKSRIVPNTKIFEPDVLMTTNDKTTVVGGNPDNNLSISYSELNAVIY